MKNSERGPEVSARGAQAQVREKGVLIRPADCGSYRGKLSAPSMRYRRRNNNSGDGADGADDADEEVVDTVSGNRTRAVFRPVIAASPVNAL